MGEPIRVLHILQRMEAGGTQALLMNIYRKIDRTKVQFDFLVVYKEKQFYDDEIEKLGGHVYKLSFREDLNLPKFQKDLADFFAQHHEYKIVHCHAYTIGYFCLKAAKKKSTSDYVIANQDGEPLSYTQFKRLWQYIVTRTAKPRIARKLVDGKYVKYMLYPKLGEKARNNGHVVYSLDFEVTPHMLRHTYITNLIHASVDPKTVQYLAGHESSKITMDIYAKVKYNKPEQLAGVLSGAFAEWDGGEYEAAQ